MHHLLENRTNLLRSKLLTVDIEKTFLSDIVTTCNKRMPAPHLDKRFTGSSQIRNTESCRTLRASAYASEFDKLFAKSHLNKKLQGQSTSRRKRLAAPIYHLRTKARHSWSMSPDTCSTAPYTCLHDIRTREIALLQSNNAKNRITMICCRIEHVISILPKKIPMANLEMAQTFLLR